MCPTKSAWQLDWNNAKNRETCTPWLRRRKNIQSDQCQSRVSYLSLDLDNSGRVFKVIILRKKLFQSCLEEFFLRNVFVLWMKHMVLIGGLHVWRYSQVFGESTLDPSTHIDRQIFWSDVEISRFSRQPVSDLFLLSVHSKMEQRFDPVPESRCRDEIWFNCSTRQFPDPKNLDTTSLSFAGQQNSKIQQTHVILIIAHLKMYPFFPFGIWVLSLSGYNILTLTVLVLNSKVWFLNKTLESSILLTSYSRLTLLQVDTEHFQLNSIWRVAWKYKYATLRWTIVCDKYVTHTNTHVLKRQRTSDQQKYAKQHGNVFFSLFPPLSQLYWIILAMHSLLLFLSWIMIAKK